MKQELTKTTAHVSEEKKELVKKLAELMKKRTVMVVSIMGLPSAQFQNIKKKLRGRAVVMVTKKSLIKFAAENCGKKELQELVKYVEANCALLFSDEDAFEISAFLAENKIPAKAKIGQEAPEDIKIEAGETNLPPGPDISALSSLGIQVKVENGKIVIEKEHVLVKKGEIINEEKASVLAKLNITPFKIGLEPLVAFCDGKLYKDIKIDKEKTIEELKEMFSKGLAFAVSLNYICKDTLTFILSKAVAEENAINNLIKDNISEEKKQEADEKSSPENSNPNEQPKI